MEYVSHSRFIVLLVQCVRRAQKTSDASDVEDANAYHF